MNITLCSSFRNSVRYLSRYFVQIHDLNKALEARGDSLYLVLGEGDSTDGTDELLGVASLMVAHLPGCFVDCTHGGPVFGSVVDAQRFKQLAHVAGCIWQHIPEDSDAILYCESDLSWETSSIIGLIDRLRDYPAISPMVFLQRSGFPSNAFYDVWAGRKNGIHFTQNPPYFNGYSPTEPVQVDSMGSCMIMNAALARCLKWDEQLFPGICSQIYQLGSSVWLDPKSVCYHD